MNARVLVCPVVGSLCSVAKQIFHGIIWVKWYTIQRVSIRAHMFRGLLYGSHRAPRELVWVIGYVIYLLMKAAATAARRM